MSSYNLQLCYGRACYGGFWDEFNQSCTIQKIGNLEKKNVSGESECLRLMYEAIPEDKRIVSVDGELTQEQIIEAEELAAIYSEFLWGGLLPLATMIFVFALVIKIIKNFVFIGDV